MTTDDDAAFLPEQEHTSLRQKLFSLSEAGAWFALIGGIVSLILGLGYSLHVVWFVYLVGSPVWILILFARARVIRVKPPKCATPKTLGEARGPSRLRGTLRVVRPVVRPETGERVGAFDHARPWNGKDILSDTGVLCVVDETSVVRLPAELDLRALAKQRDVVLRDGDTVEVFGDVELDASAAELLDSGLRGARVGLRVSRFVHGGPYVARVGGYSART